MTKASKEGQRKAPILRFKGFTDAWEQRQLREISSSTIGGGTPKSSNKKFWNGNIPWIQSSDLVNGDIWNITIKKHITLDAVENSAAKIISANSIAVVTRVAVGKLVYMPLEYATSQDFISFQNLSGDHSFFMYLVSKVMHKVKGSLQGTSIKGISKGELLKKKVIYTLNIKEQKKIGTLLKSLDTILTLYDRKLKLLSQVKKYFLDNLFAKKEYPNLRFKGFTDAWEQQKLENLSEHKGGTSIEKYFSSDGLYKVISIGSYGLNNEYIDQGIRAVKNKTTESKLVRSGQLTMVLNDKTANGNLIGRCLLISKDNEFIVNQRTEIIIPGPDLNENYAYYYLNGPFRNKVKKIAQGGTQIYVNYSSVKRQKINYPIKNEQIKISKLLKIIKSLITLYENKQHHLTEIKKTLLNTMFI